MENKTNTREKNKEGRRLMHAPRHLILSRNSDAWLYPRWRAEVEVKQQMRLLFQLVLVCVYKKLIKSKRLTHFIVPVLSVLLVSFS